MHTPNLNQMPFENKNKNQLNTTPPVRVCIYIHLEDIISSF